MSESKLRAIVGLFLVSAQFGLILLVIVLYALPRPRGFSYEEMTTTLGILAPAFAAFTLPIVKHIVEHRYDRLKGRELGAQFVVLSLLFPTLFSLFVAGSILAKAYGWAFEGFEQFKTFFGIVQALFAAYVGYVIAGLFDLPAPVQNNGSPSPK
jgi:hypothetical protein